MQAMLAWEKIGQVIAIAAAPISELRGAIPLALYYEMGPAEAYLWSVLGNMLPVPFLLMSLGWLTKILSRWNLTKKLITWWFDKVQSRNRALVERWGVWALVIFVAIPLPMTGAWSGTLIAHLFKIPFKWALPAIGLGVLIAGVLVMGAAIGFIAGFGLQK
jgi:uncharacterized membrane protein